ncbi:HalOD1 output domain-containing protein [Halorientalis pallida]|uniref:HalOD1 output domain-containing protein n=1 Tax=Halorientalis pallida TaxID=2479928 RepID=UPI003C7058C0
MTAPASTVIGGNRSVSQSVVEAVAREKGVDPSDITPKLYEAVDPEALDRIFAGTSAAGQREGRIVFTYHGCEVTVHSEGSVSIES